MKSPAPESSTRQIPRVYSVLQTFLWCLRYTAPEQRGVRHPLSGNVEGPYGELPFTMVDSVDALVRETKGLPSREELGLSPALLNASEGMWAAAVGVKPYVRLNDYISKKSGFISQSRYFKPVTLKSSFSVEADILKGDKANNTPGGRMVKRFKLANEAEVTLAESLGLSHGLNGYSLSKLRTRTKKPSESILRAIPDWALYQSHPLYEIWEFPHFLNLLRTYVDLYRAYVEWENEHVSERPPPVFTYVTRIPGRFNLELGLDEEYGLLRFPKYSTAYQGPSSPRLVTDHTDVVTGEQQCLEVLELFVEELELRWERIVNVLKTWGRMGHLRDAATGFQLGIRQGYFEWDIPFSYMKFNEEERKLLLSGKLRDRYGKINILEDSYMRFSNICEEVVRRLFIDIYEEWIYVNNEFGYINKLYNERKITKEVHAEKSRDISQRMGFKYSYYHMINPFFDFDGALKALERDAAADKYKEWWEWFLECVDSLRSPRSGDPREAPVDDKAPSDSKYISITEDDKEGTRLRAPQHNRYEVITENDKAVIGNILRKKRGKGKKMWWYRVEWVPVEKCWEREWLKRDGGAFLGVDLKGPEGEVGRGDALARAGGEAVLHVAGQGAAKRIGNKIGPKIRKELTDMGYMLKTVSKREEAKDGVTVRWIQIAYTVEKKV